MLLYVAGPYRGDIAANIQAAREVGIKLWEAGHAALTPHLNTQHFEIDCSIPEDAYLKGDLEMLARCDGVVMLPNWKDSAGATGEHLFAEQRKIPIWYWPDYPQKGEAEPNRDEYPLECFMDEVKRRLEHGATEYGAESYLFDDVTRQIDEELFDVAGWASLMWAKLRKVEKLWNELEGLLKTEVG